MNENEETLLAVRPLVLWAWLMGTLLSGNDPDPVAAYLSVAALLFASARWSQTVRRESAIALVLLDAPAIFTIQSQQGSALGAAALSGLLFATVLLAGAFTLRRALAIGLVLELFVLQAVLLGQAGGGLAGISLAGVALGALASWALWRRARQQAR